MRFAWVLLLAPAAFAADAGYLGSQACAGCHPRIYQAQTASAHSRALAVSPVGRPGDWAFGAGRKAITFLGRLNENFWVEFGQSYYSDRKAMGPTPGHPDGSDRQYRLFDPIATPLRCFRCHSTGPVKLAAGRRVVPSEPGVHCEACHNGGSAHAASRGADAVLNPGRLSAAQLNDFCGSCHRQPPAIGEENDWSNTWNVRHEPKYLARAACFRNGSGALACLTCHDPHTLTAKGGDYSKVCQNCHAAVQHQTPLASRTCVECHMPQVRTNADLTFTNHWIGIYSDTNKLVPSRRAVRRLAPAPPTVKLTGLQKPPNEASTLTPLFEASAGKTDLGLFLLSIGDPAGAEAAFRKSVAATNLPSDHENLAMAIEAAGRIPAAIEEYKRAAAGRDAGVAARSFARLAVLEPSAAERYYTGAIKLSVPETTEFATRLNDLALILFGKDDFRGAEALFRRALAIQQKADGNRGAAIASIMNNLGKVLQQEGQLGEAEALERDALKIFEEKVGPESLQLAQVCNNLGSLVWRKGQPSEAELWFRRALAIDEALGGPSSNEVAADLTNLGLVLKELKRTDANSVLVRALSIFEGQNGAGSERAAFVRQVLQMP